jgi:hypothetical protein
MHKNMEKDHQLKCDVQVIVKTSLADRKPYVFETPIGSHTAQRKKSSIMMAIPNLKIPEYILGGK